MPDNTRTESSSPAPPKKSFAQYLIDTEIFPLPLLGKSIQYFGAKEVIVFFLGAAALYGYSLYKPLPFQKSPAAPAITSPAEPVTTPPTPIAAKMINLHGSVKTQDKPLTDFLVAVVYNNTLSLVDDPRGTFSIPVPDQERYSLVVMTLDRTRMKVYGDLEVEMANNQYKLPDLTDFPGAQQ